MQIQINIPKELNTAIKVYTATEELANMQIAVIKLLSEKLNIPYTYNDNRTEQTIQD